MIRWSACAALALLCAAPAWADVVINEIETNPPGNDSDGPLEWVELYNPGPADADVGGWQIASSGGEALVLPPGASVGAGGYAAFSHGPLWFLNRGDSARLLDAAGQLVDATPLVADVRNDEMTWQRTADGLDTDSADDWEAGAPTWGESNGGPEPVPRRDPVSVYVEAGGPYVAGQPAVITGSVSEPAYSDRDRVQLPVRIEISGPSEAQTVRYPDASLSFSFEAQTGGVLGLAPGRYTATAHYAGSYASAEFEVALPEARTERAAEQSLTVWTDSQSYMPGQVVAVRASAASLVPLEGLKMSIRGPDGAYVERGTLFPDGSGGFSTSYKTNPVSALYGEYSVSASYGGAQASTSYVLSEDTRFEGLTTSLSAEAYEPGQSVALSGSSYKWVPSLDVRLDSLAGDGSGDYLESSDSVRLDGGGGFSYEAPIPEWFRGYGDYRLTVSGSVGRATHEFAVVEDAGSYRPPSDRFLIEADRGSYAPGQTAVFAGDVGGQKAGRDGAVSIDFYGPSGRVGIVGRSGASTFDVASGLSALPDPSGRFSASYELNSLLFPPGMYVARAQYGDGLAAAPFEVERAPLTSPLSASLDKPAYGLGETVTLSGTAASAADSAVITLHKPNGDVEKHGAYLDSGAFEWSWQAPLSEITRLGSRSADLSNLGAHRLEVEVGGNALELRFSVLEDPGGAASAGLTVSAGPKLHLPGSTLEVSGSVPPGGSSPVLIDLLAYGSARPLLSAAVHPGPGGLYGTSFPLLSSLFPDGSYSVRALHGGQRAVETFQVGSAEPVSVEMGRERYSPGDLAVAQVSVPEQARNYSVGVIRQSGSEQACGPTVCGEYDRPVASATAGGSFSYAYRVPSGAQGAHELTVWSGPHEAHAVFQVAESERRHDSRSRVHEDSVSVELGEGALVLSGSLLARASEADSVRLRLEAPGGECIIGPSPECAQRGPTALPHSEARVLELGGQKYWLSYSGPEARAELFELGAFSGSLPAGQYLLSAEKDGQSTSLYYRATYGPQ